MIKVTNIVEVSCRFRVRVEFRVQVRHRVRVMVRIKCRDRKPGGLGIN